MWAFLLRDHPGLAKGEIAGFTTMHCSLQELGAELGAANSSHPVTLYLFHPILIACI